MIPGGDAGVKRNLDVFMRIDRQSPGLAICAAIAVAAAIPAAARGAAGPAGLPRVWHVRSDAGGANTGQSWADAFTDLHDALTAAQPGDEIWIAAGVYTPDRGTGDRAMTFRLASGVGHYGGFAGWETSREQRDWLTNETILSGDLAGDDGSRDCAAVSNCCVEHAEAGCDDAACEAYVCATRPQCCDPYDLDFSWWYLCSLYARNACCHLGDWNGCENSFVVVTAEQTDASTRLDGVTVTRGYGSSISGPDVPSGGLLCLDCYLSVEHCTLADNVVIGMLVRGRSAAEVVASNSIFTGNESATQGGGETIRIRLRDSLIIGGTGAQARSIERTIIRSSKLHSMLMSAAEATDTLVINNRGRGLGIGSVWAPPFARNCRIYNNAGGGLEVGRATIENCEIVGNSNTALRGAGASATINNTLIAGNHFLVQPVQFAFSSAVMNNCTIAGNQSLAEHGKVFGLTNAGLTLNNSIVWGNKGIAPDTPTAELDESSLEINNSIVEGWDGSIPGVGSFSADPLFVPGPEGDYYLSQVGAGQSKDSPALDAGDGSALHGGLDGLTTRVDELTDSGTVDLGYHYPVARGGYLLGDVDRNDRIDLADFVHLADCMAVSLDSAIPPKCLILDFDFDSNVDLRDAAQFMSCFTGPQPAAFFKGCEVFDFNAHDAVDLSD